MTEQAHERWTSARLAQLTSIVAFSHVYFFLRFCRGYVFGIHSGLRPWAAGLAMVMVGSAMVGVAVALGG